MAVSVADIASQLGAEVIGDESLTIHRIKPLHRAEPGDLSFFAGKEGRRAAQLFQAAKESRAAALLVPRREEELNQTLILTPNPMAAIVELSTLFARTPKPAPGSHPFSDVHPTARIGENVSLGAFSVVGENVVIADDCCIHPHVVLYPGVVIGEGSVIHAGAIIREGVHIGRGCIVQNGAVVGSDGFGYLPDPVDGHKRIPQIGSVEIGDDVEIGANTTIDRATLGETVIGSQTKIDNLVMVGHNVEIGQRALLCGQAGISGSSRIGNNVTLAGQVGVADHVTVGDGVTAAAKTGITKDVEAGSVISGMPHQEVNEWRRCMAALRRLPKVLKNRVNHSHDNGGGQSN